MIGCLVGYGCLVALSGVYQVLSHAGWCVFVGCHLLWLHVCWKMHGCYRMGGVLFDHTDLKVCI